MKVFNGLQNSMSKRYCQKVCYGAGSWRWCCGAIKLIFKVIVWGPSCYFFFLSDWYYSIIYNPLFLFFIDVLDMGINYWLEQEIV